MAEKKQYSIVDEFGGERLKYTGTSIEVKGEYVEIYDIESRIHDTGHGPFVSEKQYLKAVIRLSDGWSLAHTEVLNVTATI